MIYVSWEDAKTYCDWLSGVCTGAYRLPTEAEWEYACRAGTSTAYAFGGRITEQQANFGDRPGKTSEVGAYRRNAFSLFDMHGNVYEWCDDGLRDYTTDTVADPRGGDARQRVLRGGSWLDDAQVLRSACRNGNVPDFRLGDVGFRCARVQE